MAQPVAEADEVQLVFRAAKRIRGAGKFERDGDISSAVMVGIRWKDWKTMPIRAPRNWAS